MEDQELELDEDDGGKGRPQGSLFWPLLFLLIGITGLLVLYFYRPWRSSESLVDEAPVEEVAPAAEAPVVDGAPKSAQETLDWAEPNGQYYMGVVIDVSRSADRAAALDIGISAVQSVKGDNIVSVTMAATSSVRFGPASSDSERAAMVASIKEYFASHRFTEAETDGSDLLSPVAVDMGQGRFLLKTQGIRFLGVLVSDGWDNPAIVQGRKAPGRPTAEIAKQMRRVLEEIPASRGDLFSVRLVQVPTVVKEPEKKPGWQHVAGLVPDWCKVYPAESWSDARDVFTRATEGLSGSYKLVIPKGKIQLELSEHQLRHVGIFPLELSAPAAKVRFRGRIRSEDAEHSASVKHLALYGRRYGASGPPHRLEAEGVELSGGDEVEVFIGINPENPPPDPLLALFPFSTSGSISLVGASSISLTDTGQAIEVSASWSAWIWRDWLWKKILWLAGILIAVILLLRWANRADQRAMSQEDPLDALLGPVSAPTAALVAGTVVCRGVPHTVGEKNTRVQNITFVPLPGGRIAIVPAAACNIRYANGTPEPKSVPVSPGALVEVPARIAEIRDEMDEFYEVTLNQA